MATSVAVAGSSSASDSKPSGVAQASVISQYIAASAELHPPRSVRRGVRVSNALARWRCAFDTTPDKLSEEERAKLHARSMTVEDVDAFVSHSWASSGRRKWIALSLEETGAVPMAAAVATSIAAILIQRTWGLPGDIWTTWAPDDDDEHYSRLVFSPLAFLSGLLATFIAGALCLGVCKRVYFIDGMCIDQCDSEKKLLGIRSIGGFLSISSQFVALWDEQYFTRLWCVYELAVYRALNPRRPVLFLPLRFRASVTVGYLMVLLSATGVAVWPSSCALFYGDDLSALASSPYPYVTLFAFWVAIFACSLMTVVLGANLELQRSLLQRQLESFDASQAGCSSQADRAEILAAIAGIYEGGLDAFTEMVRSSEFKRQVIELLSTRRLVCGHFTFLMSPMVSLMAFVICMFGHQSALTQIITLIALVAWLVAGFPFLSALLLERGSGVVRSLGITSNSTRFPRLLSKASAGRRTLEGDLDHDLGLAWAACRSASEAILCMLVSIATIVFAMDPGWFGLNAVACVLIALCSHLPLVAGAFCMLVRGAAPGRAERRSRETQPVSILTRV
uniref:Uncharacterized protein n=1 Tax=Emiliania huxleyi TaxID=2903 RepID=A0A7S3TZ06_EMIHU